MKTQWIIMFPDGTFAHGTNSETKDGAIAEYIKTSCRWKDCYERGIRSEQVEIKPIIDDSHKMF